MQIPVIVILISVGFSAPAFAADKPNCPEKSVCASDFSSVVRGLQEAGYKALIEKNEKGQPYISSAANGENFTINFDTCKDNEKKIECDGLHFYAWWKSKPYFTVSLTNKYNSKNMFGRSIIDDDGDLGLDLYFTTLGGISIENFKDVVDWWSISSAALAKLVKEAETSGQPNGKAA